ncbi:hypothetical protein ACWGID_34250 [Kribbella sp. NPDC054772]
MKYQLTVHPELRQEINRLHAAWKQDPNSDAGREFVAFRDAMAALRDGREGEYIGKQLSYGPSSHDLRDAAEIKVDVFDEGGTAECPRPSHRLVYREFEPLPKIENGRVVRDPNAQTGRAATDPPRQPAGRYGATPGRRAPGKREPALGPRPRPVEGTVSVIPS